MSLHSLFRSRFGAVLLLLGASLPAQARATVTIQNATSGPLAVNQPWSADCGPLWQLAPGSHGWLEPGGLATFFLQAPGTDLEVERVVRHLPVDHPLHFEGLAILALPDQLAPVPPAPRPGPGHRHPCFRPRGEEPLPDPEAPAAAPG